MPEPVLTITIESLSDSVVRVAPCGAVDAHTSDTLRQALDELIRGGIHKIILDFAQLEYMSSAGIGILVSSRAMIEEEHGMPLGPIPVVNASETVRDVFRILEIEEAFRFVGDLETARGIVEG